MPIIEIKNITKKFKVYENNKSSIKSRIFRTYVNKTAVDNISLNIEEGEIVGYIGPNGAGKSTTIKILSGILSPSSGLVRVNGINPGDRRVENAQNIGVVFGQRTQLWWDIPVIDSINLMKYMYNIPDEKFNKNLSIFIEILDLNEFMHKPVRQLSLGQRMRADLCCALLHDPKILYLDEPTIGLDIVVKKKVLDFIKYINKTKKTTIILTTHDLSDIESLCDRAIIIDKGKIFYDGSIENLKSKNELLNKISITIDQDTDMENLKSALSSINKHLSEFYVNKNIITIKYYKSKINTSLILKELFMMYNIVNFKIHENDLEDIIINLYKEMRLNDCKKT